MTRRSTLLLAVLSLVAAPLVAQDPNADGALQAIFTRWVAEHRVVGMIAGRIIGKTTSSITAGTRHTGRDDAMTDSTLFEIGSITKVFTGTLLADMVLKGEVALDDPVSRYLPGWTIPAFKGQQITLLDLATQSSALPSIPDDFKPANPLDPYADYTESRLVAFLGRYQLTRAPGARYEYSNLGMGLLGRALAERARKPYEVLIRERILAPLGMADTRIDLTADDLRRSAGGHNDQLLATADWHLPAFLAAGALHSTVPDLLRFAAAVRDTTRGPLAKALAFAIRPRRMYNGVDSIGLAWHHIHVDGNDVVWHNGGTGGFRTWFGVNIATQRAVVVLNNANVPMDGIAISLLRGQPPLAPPVRDVVREITLPAAALSRFVGRYELAPNFVIAVTQDEEGLWAQATGQSRLRVYPSASATFFFKVVKAELQFEVDSTGAVSGVTLRQNNASMPGRKLP
ncbi:MAG: serine hydrolase [Gemmatimonadales bacterium]